MLFVQHQQHGSRKNARLLKERFSRLLYNMEITNKYRIRNSGILFGNILLIIVQGEV